MLEAKTNMSRGLTLLGSAKMFLKNLLMPIISLVFSTKRIILLALLRNCFLLIFLLTISTLNFQLSTDSKLSSLNSKQYPHVFFR